MNTVKEESSLSLSSGDDNHQLKNPNITTTNNNKDYYDMALWGHVLRENSGKKWRSK
jgi:hypothetical protein